MANKKAKNLVGNRDQYNKYYGDFRGVDFTSDHTRVHDQRFSYAVNMYKDYQSAQGHAIETIPGFRQLFSLGGRIYGIHRFKHDNKQKTIVHSGKKLYLLEKTIENGVVKHTKTEISLPVVVEMNVEKKVEMNEHKSTSFVLNNRLYILDGTNFLYYDGTNVKKVSEDAYIPTTYKQIIVGGENANGGVEYEQRNLLSGYYYECFEIGGYEQEKDSENNHKYYYIDINLPAGGIPAIEGTYMNKTVDVKKVQSFKNISTTFFDIYQIDLNVAQPQVRFVFFNEPKKGYEIKLKLYKKVQKVSGIVEDTPESERIIEHCTIAAVYDNRVFLSGNPSYPRHVFYCGINSQTGYTDPSYWGILNYFQEGVGMSPVTALMPVADSLLVLKGDTQQDGSVYYHTRQETGKNVFPVAYPSTPGLNGTGCLGAAVNFLDDPVFISKYGLEGIGQLSVRYERSIEHRSYLIDSVLLNIGEEKLKNACLEEWNGYLLLLVDGKIFMADSRQRYTHETGVMQYEWYYLEDIGIYEGQVDQYAFVISGEIVPPSVSITEWEFPSITIYYCEIDGDTYVVEPTGAKHGGTFSPAIAIREIDGNIYFGTEDGTICCFNFDKRSPDTFEIPTEWYTFNGRTIYSGCATKMDCCGIPHLTKSTVNRSTVIKTKGLNRAAAKVAVRTNKNPFNQIARINSGRLDFADVAFGDFTFEQTLFALKENEKQWVEKQYYIYSDEFQSPFALFYISYRYMVAGRIKE